MMHNWERKITLLSVVFWALAVLSCGPVPQSSETVLTLPQDGVLVHISHGLEHPHRVLMGLKMADVMSQDKKVLVYFDVEGIQVVLQESQEISKEGFPSAQEQIQALTDQGITIFACPSCLNAAGKTEEDLIEGVKLAEKEAFFSFTDGRIITFDY